MHDGLSDDHSIERDRMYLWQPGGEESGLFVHLQRFDATCFATLGTKMAGLSERGRRPFAYLIPISQAEAALKYRSLSRSRKASAAGLLSRGDSDAIQRKVQVSMRIRTLLAVESLQNIVGQGIEEGIGDLKFTLATPIRGFRTPSARSVRNSATGWLRLHSTSASPGVSSAR